LAYNIFSIQKEISQFNFRMKKKINTQTTESYYHILLIIKNKFTEILRLSKRHTYNNEFNSTYL